MRYLLVLSLLIVAKIASAEGAGAAGNCAKYSAKLVSLQGALLISADGKGHWQPGQLNQSICQGSQVHVQPYSRASLILPSGIVLRMDESTVLTIDGIDPEQPTLLNLLKGFIHFISRTPRQLQINTPIANAGPEGTEFALRVDDDNASLWVYEGKVKFYNAQGDIRLKPGEAAQAQAGQAPQAKIDVKPQDAVNWALYYPPILPYPAPGMVIDSGIRSAINDFRQGHSSDALIRMDKLSTAQQTPYFHKVRAAMRLTLGRVELAQQDINALLATNPKDADALALQSVMALTQNRKDEAYQLAQQAVTANPQSATAYSALSYAEQGRFDLDKALTAAEKAAKLAPNDALVWARKAELELSKGDTSDSKQAAKKALDLDARLERTQTVMGFAHLINMDADDALTSFNQAIELDSTSPLARLGMGLAKIRNGDLEDGRKDLEIAAILDPNNSIVRSYLGKAYYEERRPKLADEQFKLAKERDPKDPTPYFYDAINKQTTNRPVEALHDMQKAIELNDNRGVYRSSLAIDKDLAARSAAQGRIYNELGFQQQGLLEGWKSVNRDHTNYSAHRLLADNYAALPRHEIARVSELLQSQLLQPINITPIQSNLAESNLFLLNNLGPSDLSFNEFNPLFEYNRITLQASGLVGSNNTWGNNVALSGLSDNISFSLGQFHFETDGFRENNFLKRDLYNAFIQSKVSENLNFQAEYRHDERSNGDLSQNFKSDQSVFSTNSNRNTKIDSYRIGGRYLINPLSTLLGSLIYQDVNIDTENDNEGLTSVRRNGFIAELQHIYSTSNFNSVTGFSHINQNSTQLDSPNFDPENISLIKTNFYNYSKYNIFENILATFGLSIDFFNRKQGNLELNRVNPKFGIEWTPTVSTTFRAAAFRTMSIAQATSQTIEPTQVAGFNQFFDDFNNGTMSWRFGAGVDHRFSKRVAAGIEYSERKLDFPGTRISLDRSEQLGRAYIYFTPIDNLSVSGEYYFERIDQSKRRLSDSTGRFHLAETHRFPLTLSLFHSSGLSLKIKNSFVHQSGLFASCINLDCDNLNSSKSGTSSFFVVDLNLSYRLPKRFGIISLGINNILDERFNYQNTNINTNVNPTDNILSPSRLIYSRFTLAF